MTFTHSLYPDNWSDLAIAVKQQAQWRCQKCGLQCIPPGKKTSDLTPRKRRVYTLQVHHWNRNPTDNRRENLVALCTACHLYYHQGGKSNVSPGQLSLW
ncbi:MAG: HNH endonuclease [Stigonema ocellatum SAG 48.90 = DSM 106950]|nr:HNH endonuclease [Stigonema ocellatum SAG 48.90 = DSM 106950]